MEDGHSLDEDKVASALKAKNLTLTSFTEEELPMPTSMFRLAASGLG